MNKSQRTIPVVSIAILLCVVAVIFMTADERYVAIPGLACIVIVLWLWMRLWDIDQKIPFFDVGIFCALATLVYSVYPLVNYWADGLQFGPLSDIRLQLYNVSSSELGAFHIRHVLYLFSFVLAYSLFRRKGNMETGNVNGANHQLRQIIIIGFLLLTSYFFVLKLTTGVNYNTSYEPEAYAGAMAAYSNIPYLLLQISSKLAGILFLFKLGLLFIVVSRCKQKKWRYVLAAWIVVEIIQTVYIKGARTGLVFFIIATALFYHRLLKPFSLRFLLLSGTIVFGGFIFLGIYRSYFSVDDMQVDLSRSNAGILSAGSEFQTLLGTSYDVYRRKEAGTELPWYLYLNDIMPIFPPQQMLGFEKVPASEWYLRQIGLSQSGQGQMWGVITQSIIGLDWIELVIRGAILGFLLARFHGWYIRRQSRFWATLLYMFICLKVYYTFRETTFSLLSNVVWEVIPFYIILRIGVTILSHKGSDQAGRRIAIIHNNIR